ncbi:MAG: BolA/IbaG family iron-sulfur metabolism protein [Alphaproteobacteria bacterium]|nr:BolA/IbaG family iron-sulfur metabolism protein [Alphaproteobacteria bacterium]MDD9920411.1 BolA/IbaG family iron-sulfur metabolism protein [Alphaproteobacteria bacterium]
MLTQNALEEALHAAFQPSYLHIADDSDKHAGHAAAQAHRGKHYTVVIVSDFFKNTTRLQRHRSIYQVLEKSFTAQHIHALALRIFTPEEWKNHPFQRKLA